MSKDNPTREEMFIGQAFAGLIVSGKWRDKGVWTYENGLCREAKRLGECMEVVMTLDEGKHIH